MVVSAIGQTNGDRYPIVKNGKVGFIDQGGNEVIAPQFFPIADMQHFREGLAPVVSPDGAGYIDESGRFVIGPTHAAFSPISVLDGGASRLVCFAKLKCGLCGLSIAGHPTLSPSEILVTSLSSV